VDDGDNVSELNLKKGAKDSPSRQCNWHKGTKNEGQVKLRPKGNRGGGKEGGTALLEEGPLLIF